MPANVKHNAVRLLVRMSEKLDQVLFPTDFSIDGNQDFVVRLYRSYLFSGATIVEVGGGKHPLTSIAEKHELKLRIIGFDISSRELEAAPADVYDETVCADITQYSGSPIADIVVCAALLEHVRDTQAAVHALSTFLRPGGLALLFVPCRNALYARINRIAPEGLKRKVLKAIYGEFSEVKAGYTGFPSFYVKCTPRDICDLARSDGFTVQYMKLYFSSSYFKFCPPLHLAWRVWQLAFRKMVGDQAAETFAIVLKKSGS